MDSIPCGTNGCDLQARHVGVVTVGEAKNQTMGEADLGLAVYECADGHTTWVRS